MDSNIKIKVETEGMEEGKDVSLVWECIDKVLQEPSAQPDRGYAEQIKWKRDIAIQQLKELVYCLGEKIRTDGDTVSRRAAIDAVYERTRRIINHYPNIQLFGKWYLIRRYTYSAKRLSLWKLIRDKQ